MLRLSESMGSVKAIQILFDLLITVFKSPVCGLYLQESCSLPYHDAIPFIRSHFFTSTDDFEPPLHL